VTVRLEVVFASLAFREQVGYRYRNSCKYKKRCRYRYRHRYSCKYKERYRYLNILDCTADT
jgi:hypothetical protein